MSHFQFHRWGCKKLNNALCKKFGSGLFGWEHKGGWVTEFSLFPSSSPRGLFFLNFSQPLPPIYLPPPTYFFVSTYLLFCIYLPPSLLPIPLPIPIPTLLSLPSHCHLRQCALIPRSWCSCFLCSSLSLLMLLVLLMLFALTPSAPHSCFDDAPSALHSCFDDAPSALDAFRSHS
jgi:hypothetical protein